MNYEEEILDVFYKRSMPRSGLRGFLWMQNQRKANWGRTKVLPFLSCDFFAVQGQKLPRNAILRAKTNKLFKSVGNFGKK